MQDMSDNNVEVVIITNDSQLRESLERSRPADIAVQYLNPPVVHQSRFAVGNQYWIDLDAMNSNADIVPGTRECKRRIYFFSDPSQQYRDLPTGLFIRKPCTATIIEILWAGVHTTGERVTSTKPITPSRSAPAELPGWILDLHELDLRTFCHKCVEILPTQLGYQEIALYLHEEEQGLLTLAKTNAAHSIDLAVPLRADHRHPLACAARSDTLLITDDLLRTCRQRNLQPPGGYNEKTCAALIAPLRAHGALEGALLLTNPPCDETKPLRTPPERLFEFLGLCLRSARQYLRARIEARIDRLTGLYNYRWMIEALGKEIRRSQRFQTPLTLIMIDLDELKMVNDRFGHLAGDALIRHAAGKIGAALRQIDSAARIGGDEFIVLLPATALDGARHVAERILSAVSTDAPVIEGNPLSVAISIGVAQWQTGWNETQLLAAADKAMYEAKRQGHNRMACHDFVEAPPSPDTVAQRVPNAAAVRR